MQATTAAGTHNSRATGSRVTLLAAVARAFCTSSTAAAAQGCLSISTVHASAPAIIQDAAASEPQVTNARCSRCCNSNSTLTSTGATSIQLGASLTSHPLKA